MESKPPTEAPEKTNSQQPPPPPQVAPEGNEEKGSGNPIEGKNSKIISILLRLKLFSHASNGFNGRFE